MSKDAGLLDSEKGISEVNSPLPALILEVCGQLAFLNQDVFRSNLIHPWVLFAPSTSSSAAFLGYRFLRIVGISVQSHYPFLIVIGLPQTQIANVPTAVVLSLYLAIQSRFLTTFLLSFQHYLFHSPSLLQLAQVNGLAPMRLLYVQFVFCPYMCH